MQRSTSSDRATNLLSSAGLFFGALIVTTLPPAQARQDPVASRGLEHTTRDRALIERALAKANALLPNGHQMVASWSGGASAVSASTPILYAVSAPSEVDATPAAVPRGCKCVFVNPKAFAEWLAPHSAGEGRMTLDPSLLLTFMLLHEAGHIANDNPAGDFDRGGFRQFNVETTIAKANEEKADEFAATVIRTRSAGSDPASLTAGFVAMELTKLGWNMQAYRTLDEFGATAVGMPAVFMDGNYNHPNLAWRMLRSNHLIQGTEQTRQLLENFEDARRRSEKPEPLYQRKSR